MRENQRTMENTMERLATGKRINSASDDAAGLAIGQRMEGQIRGMQQASRNSSDAISMIQTADGAAIEIGEMLQRMRELAVQATNGTNGTDDISNLNLEFSQLATEIDRVANDTKFNEADLLNAGITKTFTVGSDEADQVSITIKDFNLAAGADASGGGTAGVADIDLGLAALKTGFALKTNEGVLTVSDGTTAVSINLTDIRQDAGNAALAASAITMDQVMTTLNRVANANSTFSGTFVKDGDLGIKVHDKTANQGDMKTYLVGGDMTGGTVTRDSNGAAGAAGGVLGVDMSTYAQTGSSTVSLSGTIAALDTAIVNVAKERANFGAVVNRLEYTIDNLNSGINNTKAAKSQIVDADYAQETTELARTQIISQASTAMLSQANQAAQSVLALLK
jgi:flagellin